MKQTKFWPYQMAVLELLIGCLCLLKGNLNHSDGSEKPVSFSEAVNMDVHPTSQSGSVVGGGTRAGLFRTPISGGVQSATSAHGLPRPALAVRNLMEQVQAVVSRVSSEFLFFLLFSSFPFPWV